MWGSKYSPRQYVERHKSIPVVLSRSYGPARNDNTYRSTYGVWNDNYGLRCGLWDDVLFRSSGRGNGGSRTASEKQNVSRPISQLSSPRRQFRFQVLATPKKDGCGPNCKESRCAATEYPKPFCEADKRKERNGPKRIGQSASPATVKNIYTTMANIQDRILDDENYDITMGLRNLKKVNESGDLEDLPIVEPNCERNCGECSDAPRETMEAGTDTPESGNGARDTGLKSLTTTRTVASNTEKYCEREVHEIPVRVLKDVNNNVMPERLHKTTSPIPRVKIPTPIPRVALIGPPKPKPYRNLNKLAREMIKSAVERERLPTPRPSTWSSSPLSMTSRRTIPRRMAPQTQKLMPGKLAPRLFTPPTAIHLSRTQSASPQFQTPKRENPQPQPESPQLQPTEANRTSTPQQSSNQSSKKSSKQSSKQSSNADSLVTTTSDFETSSCTTEGASTRSNNNSIPETLTPMYCRCSLCGKSESVTDTSHINSAAIYRYNPLYSPPQSLRRTTDPSPGASPRWRFLCTFLEVLALVVLGGVLTLGLIPYVESVFRAYVADFCRCSGTGKGGGGPELTADGMQSGVVKWVTCMMDDSRATLTPLR